MFSPPIILFLAALLPPAVLSATTRNTSEPFQLFVYGKGIGGFPLFFAESLAYAGNPDTAFPDDANADVVRFVNGASSMWIGSPSTKAHTTWSDVTLFVPSSSSGETRVGFLPPSDTQGNASTETTGFSWYGQTAMRIEDNGTVDTKFTALKLENGAAQIYWDDTGKGQIPVTLRSKPPSNAATAANSTS